MGPNTEIVTKFIKTWNKRTKIISAQTYISSLFWKQSCHLFTGNLLSLSLLIYDSFSSFHPPLFCLLPWDWWVGKANGEGQYLPHKLGRHQAWWKFLAPSIYGRVQSVACVCCLNKGGLELKGRSSPRSCWLLKPGVLLLIRPVYDRFHKCFMSHWWLHRWAGWWQLPPTLCVVDKRSKTRFTTIIRLDG